MENSNQAPITYLMEIVKEILYWEIFTKDLNIHSVHHVSYVLSHGNNIWNRYYLRLTNKDPEIIQLYKATQLECSTVTQVCFPNPFPFHTEGKHCL